MAKKIIKITKNTSQTDMVDNVLFFSNSFKYIVALPAGQAQDELHA
jgi:hypothetical protein